ncbi:Plus3 domain-containing protein [Forsythia ovata]|uniref:Plus3 domain-containing protein n=1 Tax=Forsythia ovata TaxID=205694 RepID=A0ABD1SNR1_9LAMI
MAGPSGVIESGNDGESINPRTHKVNLGLDPNEMDLVEGWIEHVRELSRGHEDSDSDPGSWACNQYHFDLSPTDFTKIMDLYRVPEGVRLIFPSKAHRLCSPPEGHVAIMSDAFACGMRLPLPSIFRAIPRSYNVCPYQVFPNFWTQAVDGEPAERVKDWYCLTPKGTHGPVITRHPSSIKHWRNQWLWAAGDWQCFPSDLVFEITVPQTLSHQRSSTLPKSGLAGLAAKRIPSVVKNKSSDNDQKKILAGLSLKGGEKNQDVPPAPVDPRQTILAPTVLP